MYMSIQCIEYTFTCTYIYYPMYPSRHVHVHVRKVMQHDYTHTHTHTITPRDAEKGKAKQNSPQTLATTISFPGDALTN